MTEMASELELAGFTLRSGGAAGADTAFESGVKRKGYAHIFRPHHATPEAETLAGQYHPAWERCGIFARKLHARNMQIMLGQELDKPVDFVLCWTPKGEVTGGTGQALRYALANNIPIINLGKDRNAESMRNLLRTDLFVDYIIITYLGGDIIHD